MGKRILVQRRGRGGSQFRAPVKGRLTPARYPFVPSEVTLSGTVTDLVHEPGRLEPLAHVQLTNGRITYLPAADGLAVGDTVELGPQAGVRPGNILPLNQIPEGTTISNIELTYGDGGRIVRTSGASATLFSQTPGGAVLRLPSGKTTVVSNRCRAMIGRIAGGGRLERPFLRAGEKYHAYRARGRLFPRMRGIAMSAVYHPFGGGRHQHPGKSTSTSRNAPPGRKVGLIAPRKTGRKRVRVASEGRV